MGGGIFSLGDEQLTVKSAKRSASIVIPGLVILKYRNDWALKNKNAGK